MLDKEKMIKDFEKVDYSDFVWICDYCNRTYERFYELAKFSFKQGYIWIPGNKFKIVNIDSNGVIQVVCPRCFSINSSENDLRVRKFCEFISHKKKVNISKDIFVGCWNKKGCGQSQLARLMISATNGDRKIVFSISGDNKKNISINREGIAIRCPKCSENTVVNWNDEIKKFWESLIPDEFVTEKEEIVIS